MNEASQTTRLGEVAIKMFKRRQSNLPPGKQEGLEEGQLQAPDSGCGAVVLCSARITSQAKHLCTKVSKLACSTRSTDSALRQRFKDPLGWLILALLMGWRPMELLPLPDWLNKVALVSGRCPMSIHDVQVRFNLNDCVGAGLLYTGLRFMQFPRWNDEMKHIRLFLIVTFAAILELLIENYFVWY